MFGEKRGLSDVVTVSLIILLAIAAVVIVWTFVRPTIEGAGKQVKSGGSCVGMDVAPESCTKADGSVRVNLAGGEITLTTVQLIYYNAVGESKSVASTCTIAPLETKNCLPTGGPPVLTGGITKVAVAGVIDGKACPSSEVTVNCI